LSYNDGNGVGTRIPGQLKEYSWLSRVDAGSNTSTAALRVVGRAEKGSQPGGTSGPTCSWVYKYGDLALTVEEFWNLRE
jgi:hypothetical protein